MITGKITANREAIIELEVVGSNQRKEKVEAVIDTGFNGYLTLPSDLINRLEFHLAGNRRVTLGDGNSEIFICRLIFQDGSPFPDDPEDTVWRLGDVN